MKCKYCHLPAGFLRWKHKECEEKHNLAKTLIGELVKNTFSRSEGLYSNIKDKLITICQDGFVDEGMMHSLIKENIISCLQNQCELPNRFVESFVDSLPEELCKEIKSDESYKCYWEQSISKYLSSVPLDESIDEIHSCIINKLVISDIDTLRIAVEDVLFSALKDRVDQILEDGIIDDVEEQQIDDFVDKTCLKLSSRIYKNETYAKLVQALVLKDIQEGKKPERCKASNLPVLLGKTESVVWAYNGVEGYEEKTARKYIAGNRGVSVRVCKGVYYRVGATKGHSEPYQYNASMGTGPLIITNKNIIFSGLKPVKIPIGKILSYTAYSDGIELVKDGANPKPYTFVGCDAWFIINAIQLLVP